ncbi:MAG TPA: zinc ABC transporter substrate-binding protein [Methanothrix sp.]|nr:zinc ABC transporter substrate-binding protein [Methanothrix sp.]HPJ84303.1 zinc ABC transporter substrate-binding protein [Methanothrix sp.]HPR67000.1 zinc ABC transporter substrate-binding protein [Methanothrix sp.]
MSSGRVLVLALVLSACLFCGCISTDRPASSKEPGNVNVVATTVPLGHFTEMVGGDRVTVAVLVPPGTNLHTFEPSPSKLAEVEDADLYVKNGAGLEIWMERIIQANEEMLVVDSSSGVDLIESTDADDHGHGAHDFHEDILTTDPHIWLSPKNAIIIVDNICRGLTEVDPENAEFYQKNRDHYLSRLRELDGELNSTFSETDRKEFIVLHPSWSYFARDYGLVQVPILESEKEPGPRYLAEIVEVACEKRITTIFVDPNFNPKSAEIIAEEIDGRVVPLDPLAEDYIENMRIVGREIASSLDG